MSQGSTKVYRKGLPFSAEVAPLLAAMPLLEEYREPLLRLQGAWDSLALLGQMSGAATDMADTRTAFEALTGRLLDSLARRQLRHAVGHLQGRSQVAIDILVRNLFERTADVGFLASDGPLREMLQADAAGPVEPERTAALRQRFSAYVAKYSVYDQVVLLSADGRRLAALDESSCAPLVDESALRDAFEPGRAYVEVHGRTALLGGRSGLIYAAAVKLPDGAESGGARGLLCLSFKLEDEMLGLFRALCAGVPRSVLVLKDAQGRVLLTSDPWQIPLGAPLGDASEAQGWRLDFAGRDYLACDSVASGYEGYFGPGWRAQMLQPLQHAFAEAPPERQAGRARDLDTRELFDEELRSIPIEARRIQRELSRSLWNGKLKSRAHAQPVARVGESAAAGQAGGNAFAVTLLNEVERTGEQLRQVFERAIAQLEDGALDAVFDGAGFRAELAISIVNRNLYERANDCRWWALDARLQHALADGDGASAEAVLASIHALYTVYSLLLVFDASGRVVAVSDPAQAHHVGRTLQGDWVAGALGLRDAGQYVVSSHEPCGLYGDDGQAPCLVYAAGVPHPETGTTAGGIAIVFDGAPQFRAMLRAALPDQAGAAALLVTRAGEIVASSDARWSPGDRLPAALPDLAALPADKHVTGELELDGRVHAYGLAMSGGYREYRRLTPAAATDLAALVMLPLGERLATGELAGSAAVPFVPLPPAGPKTVDVASFLVDRQWLGLPAMQVVAALERQHITAWPTAPAAVRGMLGFEGRMLPVLDLGQLLFHRPCGEEAALMVCQTGAGQRLVLIVQQLGQVFVAGAEQLQPSPTRPGWAAQAQVHLLKGQGPQMLTLLDGDDLWRLVNGVVEAQAPALTLD